MHFSKETQNAIQPSISGFKKIQEMKTSSSISHSTFFRPPIRDVTLAERFQLIQQDQLKLKQKRTQFMESKSSLRYSESPDHCEQEQRNTEFSHNRFQTDQGYTSPTFLQKLKERTHNDTQNAHQSLTEHRPWIPRTPFSAIRLWNPMYDQADRNAEYVRRNIEWAIRTYGRSDISEPFFMPVDDEVISDADQLTTECETRSFMRSEVDTSSFVRNEENHEQRAEQQLMMITEKSEHSRIEKIEESERNSKSPSARIEFSDPSNQISKHISEPKTLIKKLSEEMIKEEENLHSRELSGFQRSKRQVQDLQGPNISQDDITQQSPINNVQSNIEKMTYEQLSKSIIRMLKSMDDVIKCTEGENSAKKVDIWMLQEKKMEGKKVQEEPEKTELIINGYSIGKSEQSQGRKQEEEDQSEKILSQKSQQIKSLNQQSSKLQLEISQIQHSYLEASERLNMIISKIQQGSKIGESRKSQKSEKSQKSQKQQHQISHMEDSDKQSIEESQKSQRQEPSEKTRKLKEDFQLSCQLDEKSFSKMEQKLEKCQNQLIDLLASEFPQEPFLPENQKYSDFIQENQQEVSAIYPVDKGQIRHEYEIDNESQYLRSNEGDLPFTFSQKKSMMRVFDQQFDTSRKNILKQVKEFKEIGEVMLVESKGKTESQNDIQKHEKIFNFAKSNLSDVSKSMQHEANTQNYKTLPERRSNEMPKEVQKRPEFPRLDNMMRDNHMKESVMESQEKFSNHANMNNPSDCADSRREEEKKEEEDNEKLGHLEF